MFLCFNLHMVQLADLIRNDLNKLLNITCKTKKIASSNSHLPAFGALLNSLIKLLEKLVEPS